MSLYDLPRETIDYIIRLLDDDHLALNACSLVGWLFLPSCRSVMFSTVNVEYGELGALLDIIDTPLSTVTPALRGIRFKQKPECLRHLNGGKPVPVVSREVMTILESNIRYIQLEGIPPRGIVGFWNFMAELKGVREVEIEGGIFEMMGTVISDVVVGWVCGLSELEELSVVRSPSSLMKAAPLEWQMPVLLPPWTGEGAKPKNAGGMRVSLDIGDWDQLGAMRWMLIQSPVPRVRTLRIGSNQRGFWDGGSACDVDLLKEFVAKRGSDIEKLNILLPEDAETDVLESLDLSPCINLQAIHIGGFQIGPSHRAQEIALEILLEKIVDCADEPDLRDITLTIEVDPRVRHMLEFLGIPDVALFERLDWGRIPELLARATQGSGGIGGVVRKKGVSLVVQRCSKCYHEGIEQVLRREIFRELQERASLSVRFDGGERS